MPPPDQLIPVQASFVRMSVDPVTGASVLLYPEGILELDETAAAALRLCDGQRSLADIVCLLADEYEASHEAIIVDVRDYFDGLAGRSLLAWREK